MNEIRITIGDLITIPRERQVYRVICVDTQLITACLCDVNKLCIKNFSIPALFEAIAVEEAVYEHPEFSVIDTSILSEEELDEYRKKKMICKRIADIYGPTYEALANKKKKPEMRQIEEEFNIKRETLRIMFLRYLQSGLNDYNLIDKRLKNAGKPNRGEYTYSEKRPGRKGDEGITSKVIVNEEIKKQFDEAIAQRKSGRFKSYEAAYSWLCNKYYSETYIEEGQLIYRQKSEVKIPSKRQFTYYASKQVTKQELDIIKTSEREYRNDKRLLLSDSYNDVLGPGDLAEIDALEVDVELISSKDRSQKIGRAILYMMLDVFTRMILAVSVSLHNNAMIGLTNLFLNLCDDKKKYCEEYGHFINDDAWMSNIIPRRIRVDRGSDFKSNQFALICKELGIDRQLVPGASGSLKGNIEQEFRTLQKPHLEGRGLISKRYDSDHRKTAVMTIEEYTKMAVDFVLHHNTMVCEDYPLTADMVKNRVHASPYELWKYGADKYGKPRPITEANLQQYLFTLMMPITASLDRTGITYKDLSYLNPNDQDMLNRMAELQNKREKIKMRIDPRDVSQLYYIKNNKLTKAPLNPRKTVNSGYEGMTLYEYEAFLKEKRNLQKQGRVRTQRVKNSLHGAQEAIVQEAMANKSSEQNKTNDIREKRNEEKQRIANKNKISTRVKDDIKIEQKSTIPVLEEKQTTETKPLNGFAAFEAAMNLFEDEG